MSVINRMLKDLDQRQQTSRTQTYTPAAVAPQPIHWLWIVLTVLISAAVIIGGLNLWWMYSDKSEPEQPAVQVAEVIKAPVQEETPAVSKQPQNKSIVDVSSLPTEAATEQPTREEVLTDGAISTVPTATAQSAETQTTQPQAAPIDTAENTTIAPAKPQPKVLKKQPENSGTLEVTRVQLSPEQLAQNNLEKARAAFEKGNRTEGQALLEKALVVKPDHVEVRSELAAYWYGRGMTTRALTLLQQGLDMRPQQAEWQLLFARILERIGRVEQAYTALLNIRNDAPQAPELLQLRAAAATQLGYFNEAAADYTVLASQFGEGRWWLAAAVAHEDGDHTEAAVRCYQQALQSGDLGSDAREYIDQRLAILEGY
ncbi:MAG: tetratricopeptide repeat protein [Gammaproteobacteria bacterium]|nr:tetratricopeptide repeat protein [Gammaproteobacteria bacterium]